MTTELKSLRVFLADAPASVRQAPKKELSEASKEAIKLLKFAGVTTLAIVLGLILVAVVISNPVSFGGTSGIQASDDCSDSSAQYYSEVFVKDGLSSPATAKFPDSWTIKKDGINGKCSFVVQGYVDSQNVYGALIRKEFVGNVNRNPDGKSWHSDGFTIY